MDYIGKGMPIQDSSDLGREGHTGRHLSKASIKYFPSLPIGKGSKVLGIARIADDGIRGELS
jgi:hypothetical protein